MIKKTEIIYHNSTDEVIDSFDDLLNVKVGDKFYLALRGSCPRSEQEYYQENSRIKQEFLQKVVKDIDDKCHQHHIEFFKVVKIGRSYEKDYSWSVSNPRISYTESIHVKDVYEFKDFIRSIKKFFKFLS